MSITPFFHVYHKYVFIMSNISKIKISGTSYNLKDENACKVVELTQAEYDDLPTTAKTSNSLFVITDATAGDLSNYYTKSETSGATEISTALASKADTATTYTKTETDNAITAATSTKQDTLVSGTNIKTINNQSILGEGNITIEGGSGGGKSIEAGTNISVTTGETADTINCTLPIIATTQYQDSHNLIFLLNRGTSNSNTINNENTYGNIIAGHSNTLGNNFDQAMYNFVFGDYNGLEGNYQGNHADKNFVVGDHNFFGSLSSGYAVTHTAVFGDYNKPKNHYEYAFGKYNVSNTGSTDADKTLFTVGNGTADNARHNAFEIRQNGDIYITKDGQDVKLQDQLGSGGTSYTAGDGIDISNDVISVTGKVDTSAITTSITSSSTDSQVPSAKAVYDQFGGLKLVKLTQSEYDALATKDSSTLYIING